MYFFFTLSASKNGSWMLAFIITSIVSLLRFSGAMVSSLSRCFVNAAYAEEVGSVDFVEHRLLGVQPAL